MTKEEGGQQFGGKKCSVGDGEIPQQCIGNQKKKTIANTWTWGVRVMLTNNGGIGWECAPREKV